MREVGRFAGASHNILTNELVISFSVKDSERVRQSLDVIKDIELLITANKQKKKRSLDANGYFWQLVDKIAKAVKSDKWTIYLLQLSKYGVFVDVSITRQALPELKRQFRYVEEFDDGYAGSERVTARCYFGSSKYTTKEMSDLIEGTVRDAEDLGIETLTPEERQGLIQLWQGQL